MASADDQAPPPWEAQLGPLGAFIRAQRQLADLSLREMAALTRISNAYLSQVERGLHQPSLTALRAIADALGRTTEQLLARAGWVQAPPAETSPGTSPGTSSGTSPGAPSGAADGAPPAGTEASIRADPRLTEAQREALIGVYRSF